MEEEERDFGYSLVIPRWVRHSNHPISTVSIHPSGEIFATGGWDNYVKVWSFSALDAPDGVSAKLIALLRDHTGTVNCVRFSPDGRYLATCGDDSMLFLWQRVRCFGTPSTFGIPESALLPNKPVQKWTSRAFTGHDDDVTSLSWSPDSKRIASCSIDGCVIVWDVNSGTQLWNYRTSVSALSISWDPLNKFIAVQLSDGPLSVFDTQGRMVREVNECLENTPDKPMFFRTSWSPDGSFIGAASGFNRDDFNAPFFQRGSFDFAFMLRGHVSPISCVSCSPFLLHIDNSNYGSMFAIADKQGTVSIWNIGAETKPFLVLDRLSPSCINDIAWSADGKWLLIALENDPVQHIGGIIGVRFLKDFPYEIADQTEMEEIKGRLLGETSFKLKSMSGKNISNILQSLEIKEKEVDLEVLQLTTEEVLKRQIETVVDGIHTIQPVLLTAVEKQMISFHCNIQEKPKTKIPCEFSPSDYNWAKPSALINEPSKVIEVNDSLIVASDMFIYKLNKSNGRRMSSPFFIGKQCRHLSVDEGVVLAVGDMCYLLDLQTMICIKKYQCPADFCDFTILSKDIIIARSRCKTWIYDQYSKTWIGGGIAKSMEQLSMKEIEELANWGNEENAIKQWYDFGIDCLFASYCGQNDRVKETLENMIENNNNIVEKQYLSGLLSSL